MMEFFYDVDADIIQVVERRTVNPQVPGSSPGRGAKRILHLGHPFGVAFAFSGIEIEKVRRSLLGFCGWPAFRCLRGNFGGRLLGADAGD